MKKTKLVNSINYAILEIIADQIAIKENTHYTEAYKLGLITPAELIKNSKLNIKLA